MRASSGRRSPTRASSGRRSPMRASSGRRSPSGPCRRRRGGPCGSVSGPDPDALDDGPSRRRRMPSPGASAVGRSPRSSSPRRPSCGTRSCTGTSRGRCGPPGCPADGRATPSGSPTPSASHRDVPVWFRADVVRPAPRRSTSRSARTGSPRCTPAASSRSRRPAGPGPTSGTSPSTGAAARSRPRAPTSRARSSGSTGSG